MQITVNNKLELFVENELSLTEIIKRKHLDKQTLITILNHRIILGQQRELCMLKDGDDIQILNLVTGG